MAFLRVLVLVLLALTLPVRGVMAAAMLCPPQAGVPAGDGGHDARPAPAAHHGAAPGAHPGAGPADAHGDLPCSPATHAAHHDGPAAAGQAGADGGGQAADPAAAGSTADTWTPDDPVAHGHHAHGGAGADRCNLCSACCSVPPLPSGAPLLPQPHDLAAADFPSLLVPAPSFLQGGPDRPPRGR